MLSYRAPIQGIPAAFRNIVGALSKAPVQTCSRDRVESQRDRSRPGPWYMAESRGVVVVWKVRGPAFWIGRAIGQGGVERSRNVGSQFACPLLNT